MRGIKVNQRTRLKLLQNNIDGRNGRASAFSVFGKRKIYGERMQGIKSRQPEQYEDYDEADLAYEEMKEAEARAVTDAPKALKKAGGIITRAGKNVSTRGVAGTGGSLAAGGTDRTAVAGSRMTEASFTAAGRERRPARVGGTVASQRMEAAKNQMAGAARENLQRKTYIQNAASANRTAGKRRLSLKQRKARRLTARQQALTAKVCIVGVIALVIFVCLFSGAAGGLMSSIDMKGQDNITSAYLYLGTLEAGKGKLSDMGVTIDAEPMMAYMIAEYGIVQDFDERQKTQFTKVYNAVNAKGYRNDTDRFFNDFREDVFSGGAKFETYKKLISEGIYENFKTVGSPFLGRDWVSCITSSWGWRLDPKTGALKMHKGLDIGMPQGTPINAVCSGTVVFAGWNGGYGNCVIVKYENGDTELSVLYGHMSAISVRHGMKIGEGAVVGKVGSTGYSTGPHLHIEIMTGDYSDDVSKLFYPRIYMREREVTQDAGT